MLYDGENSAEHTYCLILNFKIDTIKPLQTAEVFLYSESIAKSHKIKQKIKWFQIQTWWLWYATVASVSCGMAIGGLSHFIFANS